MYARTNVEFGNYVMDSFEFESGRVLENINVEYGVSGIPKYDNEGDIVNAVVYSPNLTGDISILKQHHDFIESNEFDKDDYFFIRIKSLGIPNSCSPSTTGLKYNFPKYTFKDRVNFKRQFLKEKFNINAVCGLVGEGLGGFEVFTWACEYPDEMEFIIVLNSAFKTYSQRYIYVKCAESILESSEDVYSEEYSPSLSKLSVALFRLLFAGYYPINVFDNLTNDEIDMLMDDYVDEGLFMDIHDFKSRNECLLEYNIEDKAKDIKAKSLLLGIYGFLFFNPEKDLLPLKDLIKDSKVVLFTSKKQDYSDEDDYSDVGKEIVSFLKKLKK